jgi:hypothetical protein
MMDDLELEAGRQLLEERNRLRAALIDILRVTREAPDNPLEDAFGHAIAYIEKAAEEALEYAKPAVIYDRG